jgi:hypothetical protein
MQMVVTSVVGVNYRFIGLWEKDVLFPHETNALAILLYDVLCYRFSK